MFFTDFQKKKCVLHNITSRPCLSCVVCVVLHGQEPLMYHRHMCVAGPTTITHKLASQRIFFFITVEFNIIATVIAELYFITMGEFGENKTIFIVARRVIDVFVKRL